LLCSDDSCFPRRESSRFLLQVLESVSDADLDEVLERILDAVEKQPRMSVFTTTIIIVMMMMMMIVCYCFDDDCCYDDEFCLCCQCPPV